MVKFKVKRLTPTAKLPERTHPKDTGYDIFADSVEDTQTQIKVYTGLAIEPPENYYIEVFPRSSVYKKHLQLANSVAVIDYDYRGEIILIFNKIPIGCGSNYDGGGYLYYPFPCFIKLGEKIAQFVVRWRFDAEWEEVSELSDTARGEGGFGSTGK